MEQGILKKEFYDLFGQKVDFFYSDRINKLEDKGLIKSTDRVIKLTDQGKLFANQVFLAFID